MRLWGPTRASVGGVGFRLDKADWQVLQAYGRAMWSVQLFELSLKGLAQLAVDVDESGSFDQA